MALKVEPAEDSDAPQIMEVMFSAFEHDPYMEALFPGDYYSAELRQSAVERTLQEWHSDPTLRYFKCVDSASGDIIGFAKWNVYDQERPEEEWKKDFPIDWCTGRQQEIATCFLGGTMAMRRKTWGGKPFVLINILCVHKDHQRRGAGALLMQWGIEEAKRLNLPAYVEASPAGLALYSKLGYKQVDTIIFKAEDWDGDHDRYNYVMIKSP